MQNTVSSANLPAGSAGSRGTSKRGPPALFSDLHVVLYREMITLCSFLAPHKEVSESQGCRRERWGFVQNYRFSVNHRTITDALSSSAVQINTENTWNNYFHPPPCFCVNRSRDVTFGYFLPKYISGERPYWYFPDIFRCLNGIWVFPQMVIRDLPGYQEKSPPKIPEMFRNDWEYQKPAF